MKTNIKTIKLGGLSGNCYLIQTKMGFILIATGEKILCQKLEIELSKLACTTDNLNLIIFTHKKSFNNINYEYLREKYKTKITMHILDEALIDETECTSFWNTLLSYIRKVIVFRNKCSVFKPDFIIDEGTNLSLYGLNARVLYLSGYSNSIGILTEHGELFCDDLLKENEVKTNSINSELMSLHKLKRFLIDIVYSSRGKPVHITTLKN